MDREQQCRDVALSGPLLRPWDSGLAVAELQELLNAHGFKLRVDGDFGWITETAVKEHQQQNGLRVDGVVGPRTWALLKGTVKPGCRLLRLGHSGADVHELQGLLRVHGHDVARDGFFGKTTKQAVLAYQQKQRLRETGMVDSITWTALRGNTLPTPPKQTRWLIDPRKWW